ncbi:MAG: hypothetical protein JO257_26985 [Deltaproteobacteria bacterium]|nr:hypothetical protein [Deltaproteobacteria bacterium]
MKRLLALLLIPACTGGDRANTGECPQGEICSPKTPKGLHFIGVDLVDTLGLVGPSATAVGGTQNVALQYDRGDGILIALDLPYQALTMDSKGVTVAATSGSVVSVVGQASGTDYLRITDTDGRTLFDRKLMDAGTLDTIQLVPSTFEHTPTDAELAWAPGTFDIGIALFGQVGTTPHERLVDDTMTLDLAGATQTHWDTLHLANAQPGTSTLMVTAGDKPPAPIDIVVTGTADSVMADQAPTGVVSNQTTDVCFVALTGSRVIVGLPWTFTVDGAPGTAALAADCVAVKTTKTTGTVTITAAAGGKNAMLTLPVSTMARTVTRTARELPTTAGERAEM